MTAWLSVLVVLAIVLAGGAVVLLRRTQTRVPDAPIVELATVPSDRRFWLLSRLNESVGGGRPPAPTLDSLTLDALALDPEVVVSPLSAPVPSPTAVTAPVATPLALPLAATAPPPRPHSPFANQAVRDGRIGLMDEAADNPAIAWHTQSAAPTTFSDPTAPTEAPPVPADGDAISLDRPTPATLTWAGPGSGPSD